MGCFPLLNSFATSGSFTHLLNMLYYYIICCIIQFISLYLSIYLSIYLPIYIITTTTPPHIIQILNHMNYKDDLFSDSNIFYRSSLPFSPLSPLKQTEYTRLRQNSGDQRLRTRFNPSSHPTSNHPTSSRQPKPKKVITHIEENY